MSEHIVIHVRKEALKFAAAHMTVFPDGTKERLHGHNYEVELNVKVRKVPLESLISFAYFMDLMKSICDGWDEKVLLPRKCPFLKIQMENSAEVDFVLCGKRYVLPAEEVVWLKADNVTTESLAEHFCEQLVKQIKESRNKIWGSQVFSLSIRIDETQGQGATFECRAE